MKIRTIRFMGLIASVLALLGLAEKDSQGQTLPPPPTVAERRPVSFEEQWQTFQELGFRLNPGIDKVNFEQLGSEKLIAERPFAILYMELGRTIQREPWTPLTDRVWDFDVEAIEDHGAYVEIMQNLERLSRGELRFENLKDYVDIEADKAWVSFTLRGKDYKWDLKVDEDWTDPGLFTKLVTLTNELKTKGRYTYFFTGGQNAVIGYETPESRDAIIKATELKIEWLD